jgi:hypothetical protein
LLEALGNFEDGVLWKLKTEQIAKGLSLESDKLFNAYIQTNPDFF